LKAIEIGANKFRQTQIFMETPYRNEFIINNMIECMSKSTRLAIAANVGGENQSILSKSIGEWQTTELKHYHKVPCIFLIGN
jgi:16S rRNA (cytidine1402-2'-O)-methyltransferase